MSYFYWGFFSFLLTLVLTPLVKKLAIKFKVLDIPGATRKIHSQPTPLLGGLAIYLSFAIVLSFYLFYGNTNFEIIPLHYFVAIMSGGAILMVGGFLDDRFNLPPKYSWIFPSLAALTLVLSGVGLSVKFITNPFGPALNLDFKILGVPFAGLFIWLWCMGMMYTTKFLDGLDGLCTGISLIAGLTLFTLSLLPHINQPMTASLAIIFSGSLAAFLIFAFNPASIFLGEAGSTFLGFMLAVLAVILGGKIATALLVMGIPVLDVAWVIVRRLWYGQSPFMADRQHLHFRLLDIGFSQKQSVLILYALAAVFGFTAVFLQSRGKVFALLILFALMLILAISVVIAYKKQHPHVPDLFDYGESHSVDENKQN